MKIIINAFLFLFVVTMFSQSMEYGDIVVYDIDGENTDIYIYENEFLTCQKVYTDFEIKDNQYLLSKRDKDFFYSLEKENFNFEYYYYEVHDFIEGELKLTHQILKKNNVIDEKWKILKTQSFFEKRESFHFKCNSEEFVNDNIVYVTDFKNYYLFIQEEDRSGDYIVSYITKDCKYYFSGYQYRKNDFAFFENESTAIILSKNLIRFIYPDKGNVPK